MCDRGVVIGEISRRFAVNNGWDNRSVHVGQMEVRRRMFSPKGALRSDEPLCQCLRLISLSVGCIEWWSDLVSHSKNTISPSSIHILHGLGMCCQVALVLAECPHSLWGSDWAGADVTNIRKYCFPIIQQKFLEILRISEVIIILCSNVRKTGRYWLACYTSVHTG